MLVRWMKTFIRCALPAATLLSVVYLCRGQALTGAVRDGVIWGVVAAVIYTWVAERNRRSGVSCRLCSVAGEPAETEQATSGAGRIE